LYVLHCQEVTWTDSGSRGTQKLSRLRLLHDFDTTPYHDKRRDARGRALDCPHTDALLLPLALADRPSGS
jgi:hypothetical protein